MIAWCRDLLRLIVARLQQSSVGESLMTLNRGGFCIVITTYIWIIEGKSSIVAPFILITGMAMTIAIMGHLLLHPAPHNGRRAFALISDLSIIFLAMHEGDESAATFFPLILWVICGNGFHFGLPGLWLSTTLGIIGFAAVAASTTFWREHLSLTIGLTMGMIILPTYMSILIRRLHFSKAHAEAAIKAKSDFLIDVSHELRTPLQAIIGANNLLVRTGLSSEQANLSKTVDEASNVLLTMISGLLNFSSIERGEIRISAQEFNVIELLVKVKRIAIASCQAKGLNVAMHIGMGTPCFIKGDKDKIRDVLLNLIGNAIKFTERGGLLITVSAVKVTDGKSALTFEVIDTGSGISSEIQDKIFERSFSNATASNQSHKGLGIGLAICKKLVTAMGGEIGLHGNNLPGATVWFRVPMDHVVSKTSQAVQRKLTTVLSMPSGIPKGRLHRMMSQKGRNVLTSDPRDRPFSDLLQGPLDEHRVLLVRTPKSDPVYAGFAKLLRAADANLLPTIILVDEVGQTMPTRDLRWLAPLRLVGNFTDDDMAWALQAADTLALSTSESVSDPQPAPAKQHKVLIVDNNRTNRAILAKMVESSGHLYSLAANGEEALIALEKDRFSIVLMDVNMPGINVLETTKLQRLAELGMFHTPIVGMIADASPELLKECQKAGLDKCVVKPVNTSKLQDILTRFSANRVPPTSGPGIVIPFGGKAVEPDVDDGPNVRLQKIGGREFVQEVLIDFGSDAELLVEKLNLALAQADVAAVRSVGHALASAGANIGAVRVRSIGLKIERIPEADLNVDGYAMVRMMMLAIEEFMNAMRHRAL